MVVGSLTENKDVVVIGGGPGGYVAAIRAAQLGKDVTVIEKEALGGVCLNKGCIPMNALVNLAFSKKHLDQIGEIGINIESSKISFPEWQDWKDKKVSKLTGGVSYLFKSYGIEHIQGTATFQSDKEIRIEGETGRFNLEFEHAVIAAGARPISIPELEIDNRNIITSYDALSLTVLPESLTVIGTSDFSFAVSTMLGILGTKVTILYSGDEFLPFLDPDAVKLVKRNFKKNNVTLVPYDKITGSSKKQKNVSVKFKKGDEESELVSEKIMLGLGFEANTEDLNLDSAGISLTEGGFVKIDEQCRTSVPNIYAVGDITGAPFYANRASMQGKVAAEVITGKSASAENVVIPNILYLNPEIAWAGLQEHEASSKEIPVKVGKFPLGSLGKQVVSQAEEGFVKLIFEEGTGIMLGGLVAGENASQFIAQVTMGIEMAAHIDDFALTVPVHPSTPEAFLESADDVMSLAVHLAKKK